MLTLHTLNNMLKTIKNTILTKNIKIFVVFHIRSFRYSSLYQKSSLKMHGRLKISNPYGQLRCEKDKILYIYPCQLVCLSSKHHFYPPQTHPSFTVFRAILTTFRPLTPEPDFSRTCSFHQNERIIDL